MTTMRSTGRSIILVGALVSLVACGRSSVEVDAGVGQQAGRWTLAAVAAECQRTATAERPGVVEVATELRDSNATASIGVPCVIHLVDGADVTLNRVNLTTGVLNLHDRGTGPGENVVSIERSNITARAGAGILIELNDPDDKLRMEISQISAPAGIAIRVAGQRGERQQRRLDPAHHLGAHLGGGGDEWHPGPCVRALRGDPPRSVSAEHSRAPNGVVGRLQLGRRGEPAQLLRRPGGA